MRNLINFLLVLLTLLSIVSSLTSCGRPNNDSVYVFQVGAGPYPDPSTSVSVGQSSFKASWVQAGVELYGAYPDRQVIHPKDGVVQLGNGVTAEVTNDAGPEIYRLELKQN